MTFEDPLTDFIFNWDVKGAKYSHVDNIFGNKTKAMCK